MSDKLISPEVLKGFRDYLPDAMMAREKLIETARGVYRSYGFSPIDTPALEYARVLTGKGGDESDKQLFRFTDAGERDVAMRFDLTVPFARFAALHLNEIGTPFKRYHIGTVWRSEKPQKGRYREFMQCDFDTIGTDSNAADIETLLVIYDLMLAIGFEDRFRIRVNNRLLLNGLFSLIGIEPHQITGALRALDKLPKIHEAGVEDELITKVGLSPETVGKFKAYFIWSSNTARDDILTNLETALRRENNEVGLKGVANLREIFAVAIQVGIPSEQLELDISIARGLDYYTGTIYETFLTDLPGIGSVCSGGRYDNLAGLFTTQKLPGVGASLGLDRLLAAMEELGLVSAATTPAQVFIPQFDEKHLGDYMQLGRRLRAAGIATEVFPDAKKLGKQLQYADIKGFAMAIIAGSDEFAQKIWTVKQLKTGTQQIVADAELETVLRAII